MTKSAPSIARLRFVRSALSHMTSDKRDIHMQAESVVTDIAANPHILRWIVIIIIAALGYTVATVGMKYAALGSLPVATILIVTGFILATIAEVFLLKRGDLTVVYVTIIGVETIMILIASALLGEIVDLRRMAGAGCVVVGIALCSS